VTETELRKIRGKLKEIESLKKQMEARRYKLADSVHGSMAVFPYVEHVIAVTGIRDKKIGKGLETQKAQLKEKIKEVLDMVRQANEYIDTIPDADTRIVLRCRYINQMTWEQIAYDMGVDYTTVCRKYRKWNNNKMP
jgi:DNA-directed RNA polymerase specialized sigma subunit